MDLFRTFKMTDLLVHFHTKSLCPAALQFLCPTATVLYRWYKVSAIVCSPDHISRPEIASRLQGWPTKWKVCLEKNSHVSCVPERHEWLKENRKTFEVLKSRVNKFKLLISLDFTFFHLLSWWKARQHRPAPPGPQEPPRSLICYGCACDFQ